MENINSIEKLIENTLNLKLPTGKELKELQAEWVKYREIVEARDNEDRELKEKRDREDRELEEKRKSEDKELGRLSIKDLDLINPISTGHRITPEIEKQIEEKTMNSMLKIAFESKDKDVIKLIEARKKLNEELKEFRP